MKIKEMKIEQLSDFCGDLLSKTYLELGQNPKPQDVATLGISLVNDLSIDFPSLTTHDITHAFRNGVRNTDEWYLNVKVYYKWINTHKDLIWQNEGKSVEQIDKRLKYRTRHGTGLISMNKKISDIYQKIT